jgi:HTH-type transcriptional regulator/antitoxin MqsA
MTSKPICGACGGRNLVTFANETLRVEDTPVHKLSGLRCADCGEIFLDDASQERYVKVSDSLVLAKREQEKQELIRIRKKLKLTQHQASRIAGGGHNAFGRYERGEARPMNAVVNLFRILDSHPELLKEIRG